MNQKTDDTSDSPEPSAAEPDEVPVIEEPDDALQHDAVGANSEPADEPFESGDLRGEPAGETYRTGDDPDRLPASKPARGPLASIVASLALLLALAALAVAWLARQDRDSSERAANNEAAIASLSGNVGDVHDSLQSLESRLADIGESGAASAETVAALEREIDDLTERNQSLAHRTGNLENAISSLQGVSAGVRDTWALAEAEYYMQIANAELQLAGNPGIAALALGFADERIRQLADPALSEVRRALRSELQALESIEQPDLEGMTLTLASLADRVEALPLNEQLALPGDDPAPVDPELSGFDRAVASVKQAFGDIVSVRRTDEPLRPLMSPDAVYFLRVNLSLAFQAARLALLKGEQGVFEQNLEDAAEWLRQYYDSDSRAVASALDTISELQSSSTDVSLPDISQSLRLLRQYRTLRDADAVDANNSDSSTADEPTR